MPLHQVIWAMQGFAGAYSKIAARRTPNVQHQLRVAAIREGSFDLVLAAWAIVSQNVNQIQALELLAGWAKGIVASIFALVNAKRHTKGKPYSIQIDGNNNTVIVQNFEGAHLPMSAADFELLKQREVDNDLGKIVRPLQAEQIERVRLEASDKTETIRSEVKSDERNFFTVDPAMATTSKEGVTIEGSFISLNKESNKGRFRLPNGHSVPYTYTGADDPPTFHLRFSQQGRVRVTGTAHFDENLAVTRLDITDVEILQALLFSRN